MKKVLLLVLTLALASFVQSEDLPPTMTLDVGTGISLGFDQLNWLDRAASLVGHSVAPPNQTGRFFYQGEFQKTEGNVVQVYQATYSAGPELWDYPQTWDIEGAWMMGLTTSRSWWQLSAAAGLGLLVGIEHGKFLRNSWNDNSVFATHYVASLSIPLELRAAVYLFDHVGAGFKISTSINAAYPNFGLANFISLR